MWSQLAKRLNPHFNFLTLHYIYIVGSTLIGSLLIFAGKEIAYIDALLFAGGATSQAGMNPVNMNLLNTWQQFVVFWLSMTTNIIIINTAVVVVRFYWFHTRLTHIVNASKEYLRLRSGARSVGIDTEETNPQKNRVIGEDPQSIKVLFHTGHSTESRASRPVSPNDPPPSDTEPKSESSEPNGVPESIPQRPSPLSTHASIQPLDADQDEIEQSPVQEDFENRIQFADLPVPPSKQDDFPPIEGVGLRGRRRRLSGLTSDSDRDFQPRLLNRMSTGIMRPINRVISINTLRRRNTGNTVRPAQPPVALPYLTFAPTIGRNSVFVGLTEEQKDELGGVEYRALKDLLWILFAYFFGFLFFSWLCYGPWIARDSYYGGIVNADGIGRSWWAIFTTVSMFSFALTPDGMLSFQQAVFPLLIGCLIMVAGNTGFPCLLRLVIWVIYKLCPQGSVRKETFAFLLEHPRRCFTLLFPTSATWWLFGVLVLLNVLDLFFFLVLDASNPYVLAIPVGYRWLDGLFQALSTRTTGLSIVNLQLLNPAILVSYLVMMYISVYPVAISLRRTNVYEEQSLGLYADDEEDGKGTSFVATHIRRQLSFDLWYIFLGVFIICIVESDQIEDTNNYWFNIFNILFECVSAYGGVGLSIGYPTTDAAFSSQFHVVSKLVIVALMMRGRHRGLPYALDRAIMLPPKARLLEANTPPRRFSVASARRRATEQELS